MSRRFKSGDVVDGRYQIATQIGRGTAARVYSAKDLNTDREIALKVMRGSIAKDAAQRARFEREAKLQARVSHRNVAALFGGGTTAEGSPYLALELLRGKSLRDTIREHKQLDAAKASSICWQALKGLEATHALGIVHRDLKPANLMLESSPGPVERVVVIDFGFASLRGGGRITATGQVVGSLGYLAPERLGGQENDPRSDLYGIGIILYELLTGRRPFIAVGGMELVTEHLEADVPPIASLGLDIEISTELEQLIRIALEKDPANRFANATMMADRLAAISQSLAP